MVQGLAGATAAARADVAPAIELAGVTIAFQLAGGTTYTAVVGASLSVADG